MTIFSIFLTIYLNSFDLDGDGFFSGDEITPEQQQAMQRVSNDTGRALAPLQEQYSHLFTTACYLVFMQSLKKSR